MIMCIQNLVLFCQFVLKILSKNRIMTSIKGSNSVANLKKTTRFTIPTQILSMIVCLQSLVSFCQFVLKILSKNQILMLIKGRNSVANLRKTKIYNTNVDLVNDNVYTKFGLNRPIRFQDIEQKLNSDVNQGPNSVANLPKFELIQAFMHVLDTCKNEEDPIKNEGARVFTRFLPL